MFNIQDFFNTDGKRNMFKQFRDKVALSGITVLIIGVALLIFTFVSAYGFMTQSLSIIASADLMRTIGQSLPSVIGAGIHALFLGIMVWIGSLLTIRGITIIAHLPETSTPATQKPERMQQPEPKKTETEKQPTEPIQPEPRPAEPQFIVIPPEETQEITSPPSQPEKRESQTAS
jgi:outer membrane biosynthesis protein TonB